MGTRWIAESLVENNGPLTPEEACIIYNSKEHIDNPRTIIDLHDMMMGMEVSSKLTVDDSGRYHRCKESIDVIREKEKDAN